MISFMDREDLLIELLPGPEAEARARGGMTTGDIDHGVKVTHLPTGLSASSSSERSQLANMAKAAELLREMLAGRDGQAR